MRLDFDTDGKKAVAIYEDPIGCSSNSNSRDRTTTGILALLTGGVGGQFFYLGSWGLGIACVLFFWTWLPAIFSLVQAIRYLCMSDQVFQQKFQKAQGKGPFATF